MSIKIDETKCVGCRQCVEVCPGNLIKVTKKKASIKHIEDCWGCTSCIKTCPVNAICFFLGADIGGKGSTMTVTEKEEYSIWTIHKYDDTVETIRINKKDSNKY